MNTENRNWGVDALRILSMFQILIIHTLKQGGMLEAANDSVTMSRTAWFIEVLCFGCVNLYALTSGYVGHSSKMKPSKFINLWLEVFWYSALIMVIFKIISPASVNLKTAFRGLLPVVTGQYWYISGYFLLMFFMPLINGGLNNLTGKQLRNIVICLFVFTSVLPAVISFYPINVDADAFVLTGGYSVIWLLVMYVFGAYLSKAEWTQRAKAWVLSLIALMCVIVTWESLFFLPKWTLKRFGEVRYSGLLLSYTSPTIVIMSVCVFVLFAKMGAGFCKASKAITFVGTSSLAVYLIHTHPLIWETNMKNYAVSFVDGSPVTMILKLLGATVVIFVGCIFMEMVRRILFKALKINEFVNKRFN